MRVISNLKEHCAKIIKSILVLKTKTREIEMFVDAKLAFSNRFVLGKPICYYEITQEGIINFINKI